MTINEETPMAGTPDTVQSPEWPCRTPDAPERTPERLVAFLYLLHRDHVAPGDVEQALINVKDHSPDWRSVTFTNPHLEALARAHASYLMDGTGAVNYPYEEGDVMVLGPQCIATMDGHTINWRGANYRVDDPEELPPHPEAEEPASDVG